LGEGGNIRPKGCKETWEKLFKSPSTEEEGARPPKMVGHATKRLEASYGERGSRKRFAMGGNRGDWRRGRLLRNAHGRKSAL